MKSIKEFFENSSKEKLFAKLDMPANKKPLAYALFAHCFTCSKNLKTIQNITRALTLQGIAVLRFDFTGLGESEGSFENTNFSSNIDDLVAAANFLEKNYSAPKLLIGHSLGGTAMLFASHLIKSTQAIATIAAPFDPNYIKKLFTNSISEINKKGEARVAIEGRSFIIKKQFLDDLEDSKNIQTVNTLNKPLLVLHSPQDTVVNIENATQIYQSAKHPKSFVSVDGSDHLLSKKKDACYVGEMIAHWAKRYISLEETEELTTHKSVVTRTEDDYTTEIRAGIHGLIADEPLNVGGNNLGPTPYEFLLAALGACTGITLRMYANRKKWPLKEVKVHLKHEKKYEEDCENCEKKGNKIDFIEREVELEGNLDDQQTLRLLEIADKCPVHKTLHSSVKVKTVLRQK